MQQRSRSKIQTMDPSQIGDVPTDEIGREFFETLYYYDYLKRPETLIPELAAAMPDVSEDGMVYTIPIKQDVYFHDDPCFPDGKGRKLVAEDFIYAWKRIANVKNIAKNWWIFDGRVVGLDDFREYTKTVNRSEVDYSYPVEGLKALDDFTLQVRLTRPWPQFLFWLAHIPTAPMAKEAVDKYKDNIRNQAVGTGPYIMKTWAKGSYIKAVRNPNYREEHYPSEGMPEDAAAGLLADAGKPIPFIDEIIWRIIEEPNPRWLMFMSGKIDIMTIPKDNFGQAVAFGVELTEEMKTRGIQLETFIEPGLFYLGFNMNDPILGKNKALRLAINYCIDRDSYIDVLFNGRGVVADGFISPAMAAYDPEVKKHTRSVLALDLARDYLRQAEEFNRGPISELSIGWSGTSTSHRQQAQFIQNNFRQLGLKVKVDLYDWPTFLEKMRKNQLQMYGGTGWAADYPDTESFLQIFYSKNASWPNSSNYNSPKFDAIYEKVSVMPDSPERTKLYQEAERLVIEDMPVSFLYHRIGYILYHSWIENFKPSPYKAECMGAGHGKYYKINTQKREEYRRKYR